MTKPVSQSVAPYGLETPSFSGVVDDGERVILDNPQRYHAYKTMLKGQRISLVLQEHQASSGENPRGFYFGVVIPILTDADIGYERHEWHDVLKNSSMSKLSPKMPNKELGELIDSIRRWAAQFHGVKIPEPNEIDLPKTTGGNI